MKYCYYAIGLLVVALIYFGLGSIDCEAPSLARFAVPAREAVPDDDNVYCGIASAEKSWEETWTGNAVLHKRAAEELDAVLATNAEAIAAFLQASRRSAWQAPLDSYDGGRVPCNYNPISSLAKLCEISGSRQLERGETGAAAETARDLIVLGRKMAEGAEDVLVWMLAAIVAKSGNSLAVQIAKSGKATPEDLRMLQEVLREARATSWRDSLRRAMKFQITIDPKPFESILGSAGAYSRGRAATRLFFKAFEYHPNRTRKIAAKRLDKILELMERDYDEKAWDSFVEETDFGWIESVATCRVVPNFMGRRRLQSFCITSKHNAKRAWSRDSSNKITEAAVSLALMEGRALIEGQSLVKETEERAKREAAPMEEGGKREAEPADHGAAR